MEMGSGATASVPADGHHIACLYRLADLHADVAQMPVQTLDVPMVQHHIIAVAGVAVLHLRHHTGQHRIDRLIATPEVNAVMETGALAQRVLTVAELRGEIETLKGHRHRAALAQQIKTAQVFLLQLPEQQGVLTVLRVLVNPVPAFPSAIIGILPNNGLDGHDDDLRGLTSPPSEDAAGTVPAIISPFGRFAEEPLKETLLPSLLLHGILSPVLLHLADYSLPISIGCKTMETILADGSLLPLCSSSLSLTHAGHHGHFIELLPTPQRSTSFRTYGRRTMLLTRYRTDLPGRRRLPDQTDGDGIPGDGIELRPTWQEGHQQTANKR